jgi:hypothetical protein
LATFRLHSFSNNGFASATAPRIKFVVSKLIGFVSSQEIMAGLLLSYDIHYILDITDTQCVYRTRSKCVVDSN